MSVSRNHALDGIRSTSYARAVEQAISFAENGGTPLAAIHSVNMNWNSDSPSWDDAIYVLAYAWRRTCSSIPRSAFEVHRNPAPDVRLPKPQPVIATADKEPRRVIECMRCSQEFLSHGPGNRHCIRCVRKLNKKAAGSLA